MPLEPSGSICEAQGHGPYWWIQFICFQSPLQDVDTGEEDIAGDEEGDGVGSMASMGALVGSAAQEIAGGNLHVDILGTEDGNAGEVAVEFDNHIFVDEGMAQVELYGAEAAADVGTLEELVVEIELLLAKGDVDLLDVLAIATDMGEVVDRGGGFAPPHYQGQAYDNNQYRQEEFAHQIVGYDVLRSKEQQHADAQPQEGGHFVARGEEGIKAGHDDEEGPPAIEDKIVVDNAQQIK